MTHLWNAVFMYLLIPNLKRFLAPSAQLAITVALNMQDGSIETLSQDVNLFIYLSLLQYCQKANVCVGEIQHRTISTMWDFISVQLLLWLPLRHQRHKDMKEQSDWPPFTRIVKVDKLAADGREKKATWQHCSHFPKCPFSVNSPRLFFLPVFGRMQTQLTLIHGAAVLQEPGKVCPHLGDFPHLKKPPSGSKNKAKKKWNADDSVTGTFHVPPCLYGAQSTHNAQLRQEFRKVKLCIYVWWRITTLI